MALAGPQLENLRYVKTITKACMNDLNVLKINRAKCLCFLGFNLGTELFILSKLKLLSL